MRTPVPSVDIRPDHWAIVRSALRRHVPDRQVLAFGSRATWTAKDYSDLDLAVMGEEPLSLRTVSALDEALGDSDLPFKVDVVDWARTDDAFRRIIRLHGIVVQGAEGSAKATVSVQKPSPESRDPAKRDRKSVAGVVPLEGLAHVIMGQSPAGSTVGRSKGMPLINGPTEFGPHHPKPVQYTSEPRRLAQQGDLLFCVRGATAGRMNWADQQYAIGRGIAAIRHRRDHDLQPFLRAAIISELPVLLAASTGSVFRNVSASQLKELRVPDLRISQQRAIAHILGTLDDKIELNRRMNETLEAMARALFKSWFVDFDPVRARMAGRDTGLPQEIADLFPDRLVDSELGEMPEGWHRGTLNDLAHLNPESWGSRNAPDRIRYVDLANTKWGSINDIKEFTWEDAPSRGRRVLRRGDTIVGTVRPRNGSFALIDRDGLTGSTAFAVLRPATPTERELVWCTATSEDSIKRLAHLADGGAYPAVRPRAVLDTAVTLPTPPIRLAFSSLAAPLVSRMGATQGESRTLAALRDTILPKLISGEIRVAEAETLVGARS